MKFRVEVVCISDSGRERRSNALEMERRQLAMETLGLNLCESKAILESLQDFVITQQAAEDLEQRRCCPNCGDSLYRQGRRNDRSENVVWSGASQPTLESLLVSTERPQDIPAGGGLAAWQDHSGVAVRGKQVGIVDPVCQGCRLVA